MEVPLVGSDATRWARITVPGPRTPPASRCSCPPPGNAAGAVLVPSASNRARDCFIIWRFHEVTASVLEIVQLSSQQDLPDYGLRLSFEEPLCPFASIVPIEVNNGQGLYFAVTLVATSGVVYIIKVPVSSDLWSNFALPSSSLMMRDLSSDFFRLNQVTTFAAASNVLFAGGQNGSVLCFSLFTDPNIVQDISHELKGGDAGLSRLWGLVSRNKTVGSVRSLAVQEINNRAILFALHEDGSLQAWDPLHHARLFNHNICPLPELTGSVAINMWMEDGASAAAKQVAVLFSKTTETGRETICVYSLDPLPSHSLQLGPPTLLQAIPIDQGVIVDVKLVQGSLWLLKESISITYDLVHVKLQLGVVPQHYHLQEEEVSEQLVHGENEAWDDLIFALSSPDMGETSLSELFLRRLLQPGVFHYAAFQEVLRSRGSYISDSDLRTLSIDDWRKSILSAVDSEAAGDSHVGSLKQWNGFITDYVKTWRQKNNPCALFSDVTTCCMGLVRRSSLSLIRSQSGIEKTPSINLSPLGDGKDNHVLDGLFICMREITSHLGKLPLAMFHESLLQSRGQSLDQLVCSYLHILDIGYQSGLMRGSFNLGLDEIREKEKEHHRRQRKFNLRIFSAVQETRNRAGSWDSVIDSILAYARYLVFGMQFPSQRVCSISGLGNAFTKLIIKATSQVLWAHFEAARNLVLLLSFLINVKGQVNLNGSEASRIQLQVLPQLKEAMIINLLLHWLSVTSGEVPYSDDFNSLLSSLRIDGSNGNTISKGNTGFGQFTLAEVLASSFLDAAPVTFTQHRGALMDKGDLLDYTRGFITWLLMGQDATRPLNFPHRVIALSVTLLQHSQYRGLENFLTMIGKFANEQRYLKDMLNADGESSARLHLLGFCLLARACGGMKGTSKSQHIREASSCFFGAATGLCEANEILQALFLKTGARHIAGSITEAAWKLHYFEWVMQIFEQHNLSEGATQFALAALDQADGATNNETMSEETFVDIKGRLWANVFKFSMDLDLYGDAYCAIISNPDEEVKRTCLRRFVVVLCERKATQVLCGGELPYTGLLDTVEQELAWKAEYSDISAKPSAYKLLYAFHMHRHNYRRSAGYMYRYAIRMRDEGVPKSRLEVSIALQEQVNGLAAALNALSLVSPSFAWIDGQFTGCIEFTWSSPSKRLRVAGEVEGSKNVMKVNEGIVVDVEELEKQYAIAAAKLELVHANVKHPTLGDLPPEEVVRLLVQSGLYDTAFSTAFKLWKDSLLKRELEKVFELMARNCCTQQVVPMIRPLSEKLLMSPQVSTMEKIGDVSGASKASWQALQSNLEKYRGVHPRLPVVVAEAVLSVNKHMELPLWLIDMFKAGRSASPLGMAGQEGDPAALFRIYLDNGRLVEASVLLLEYLRAWANMRPTDIIKRKRMFAAWFPYTMIDRLLSDLSGGKDLQCEDLRKSLNAALERHLSQMKADSEDVASLVQSNGC